MRKLITIAFVVALGATALATSAPAGAGTSDYEDPFFLNWPTLLPSAPVGDYQLSSADECKNGQFSCVDRVISQMTKRYNALRCDHNSMFAFTYLRTTEEYLRAATQPGFFEDPAFINHQDALFAEYYFDQYDDWRAGRVEQVSPAWRIAFRAADRQEVSGLGNLFLGMNAHVNRDLPFVLAEIGLVKPDGTSRKPDHDEVNEFLAVTNQYLLSEAATYLDPTVGTAELPGTTFDNATAVQVLVVWRELAWRNAERLVAAPTPEARALVAEDIERTAAAEALLIREALAYPALDVLGTQVRDRNRFCEAHFQTR
ncbi:MAG TPA: DUF5995 family protein [Acidimicrobiales bacterium]|nr:DUF5995 family protein [Acidimicrobiales bacterium]